MDKITHEMRLANWEPIVQQCLNRPESQTVKQWLDENGINETVLLLAAKDQAGSLCRRSTAGTDATYRSFLC